MMNFDYQQFKKPISSNTIKRVLTPRRRAREYVLQGVYQWLIEKSLGYENDFPDCQIIIQQLSDTSHFKKCQKDLFLDLFCGVVNHFITLTELIKKYIDRPVEKLSPIELSILLIATYELKYKAANPFKVIINEAVELTKTFGGTDGYKYVNGVLDKLAKEHRKNETTSSTKRKI